MTPRASCSIHRTSPLLHWTHLTNNRDNVNHTHIPCAAECSLHHLWRRYQCLWTHSPSAAPSGRPDRHIGRIRGADHRSTYLLVCTVCSCLLYIYRSHFLKFAHFTKLASWQLLAPIFHLQVRVADFSWTTTQFGIPIHFGNFLPHFSEFYTMSRSMRHAGSGSNLFLAWPGKVHTWVYYTTSLPHFPSVSVLKSLSQVPSRLCEPLILACFNASTVSTLVLLSIFGIRVFRPSDLGIRNRNRSTP